MRRLAWAPLCITLLATAGCKGGARAPAPPSPTPAAAQPGDGPASAAAPSGLSDPARAPSGAAEPTPEAPPLDEGTADQLMALRVANDAMARGDRPAAREAYVAAFDGPITGASISAGLALAELHQTDARPSEAATVYERLIQMAPAMAEVRFTAGRFYSAEGRPEQAVEQLRRAIALQPDFLPAYPMLGGVLANTGDQAAAAELMLTYETRLKRLVDTLGDPATRPQRKVPIIDVFALVDDDRVTRALIKAVRDASVNVRLAAADVLADDGDPAALEAIAQAALSESDPIARRALTASLKAAKARFDESTRAPTPRMPAPGR